MNIDQELFRKNFNYLRHRGWIKQSDIAEGANVQASIISNLLNGKANVGRITANKIANYFDVDVMDMCNVDLEKETPENDYPIIPAGTILRLIYEEGREVIHLNNDNYTSDFFDHISKRRGSILINIECIYMPARGDAYGSFLNKTT
jgi:transcriptional regulator with XRE-family HTH domain